MSRPGISSLPDAGSINRIGAGVDNCPCNCGGRHVHISRMLQVSGIGAVYYAMDFVADHPGHPTHLLLLIETGCRPGGGITKAGFAFRTEDRAHDVRFVPVAQSASPWAEAYILKGEILTPGSFTRRRDAWRFIRALEAVYDADEDLSDHLALQSPRRLH